jgi:hypothetical protein
VIVRGRFRFGVEHGSTKHDFDAVQVDYERRFMLRPEYLAKVRQIQGEEWRARRDSNS